MFPSLTARASDLATGSLRFAQLWAIDSHLTITLGNCVPVMTLINSM
jgi:hypothetical protein